MKVDLRQAQCYGKSPFISYTEAEAAAKRIRRRKNASGRVRVYRCDFCGMWHVGESHRQNGRRMKCL